MRDTIYLHSKLLLLCTFISIYLTISTATDILTQTQFFTDNQTLISSNQRFELGFFTPPNSKNRYLGIWYKQIAPQTVVWVANRDTPLTNSSGVLKFSNKATLVLLDQSNQLLWSSNQSNAENPIAQLLDSGNLVVREENDENSDDYLWQSFDYPTNTLLPGMKLGWDLETGLNKFLVSWKSSSDPGHGDYSFKMDLNGSPEPYLWYRQKQMYRSGPWNGIQFSGVPEMKSTTDFKFKFVSDPDEKTYSFNVDDESIASRLVVNETGKLQRYTWLENGHGWYPYWEAPKDQCDNYRECGAYGICDTDDSPVCNCIKGFMPKNQRDWDLRIGYGGCVRRTSFECGRDDGFLKLKGMKLPDSDSSYVNRSMNLKECKGLCRKNCSCTGYANSDISNGGSGCILWFDNLVDLREYTNGGQTLYVRVAASELGNNKVSVAVIIIITLCAAIVLLGLCVCFIFRKSLHQYIWKKNDKGTVIRVKSQELPLYDVFLSEQKEHSGEKKDDFDLPLIDLDVIANTTDNFSNANLLGQGGFGCVYKGTLADGEQIAVKRLSKNSGQGVEEFKNEVKLIARLQHRNLVRLLGCCIEGEEKMLIYEYMSNKSLDFILFDKTKSMLLDWRNRFSIIMGIARGLLYLHQDSRFRIIHRDLKASNILLDSEMNPKISDFGMARIFGGDQIEANTRRIVGTYGYMSPEYAMDGIFSIKSDVFSYGVLVLEIISGQKNKGFYRSNDQVNLLGHVWTLWEEGKGLDLRDVSMGDSCSTYEVLRCIQVGLLCVQEHAEDRPTMASVLLMLSSETMTLPKPKPPGFSLGKTLTGNSSSSNQESFTSNQLTVTMLEAR